jgi:dTDP-4-dehydrorhamnose reductase
VVHLSTDYVFDGTKATPYNEADSPNPLSVYGKTKLAGEHAVAELLDGRATIVRTSWVCGRFGSNIAKTLLRRAEEPGPLKFVDDQIGHPTVVADLVVTLRRLASERRPGLFHVTNQGAVSWYQLAQEIFRAAGHDPSRIEPIATADLKPARPAPRPANSVLDNDALRRSGIALLPHHQASIEALVATLRDRESR